MITRTFIYGDCEYKLMRGRPNRDGSYCWAVWQGGSYRAGVNARTEEDAQKQAVDKLDRLGRKGAGK